MYWTKYPILAFLLKRLIMTFGNSINEIVIWLICYISLLLVYSILPDLINMLLNDYRSVCQKVSQ